MRQLAALAAGLLLALLVVASSLGDSAPPGATARCNDGTYSFSQHHSGTCSHHDGVAAWLTSSNPSASTATITFTLGSAPVDVGTTVLLAHRTKTSGCKLGALPDRRCSPGAYYSKLTTAVICSSNFRTSTIRNVPESEKFQVEREYGMAARLYGYTIEIDHIVSLELGGSNDIGNLFPEPGSGAANYHVKDRLRTNCTISSARARSLFGQRSSRLQRTGRTST